MFLKIWIWSLYLVGNFALQLNFYTTLGQVRQEISIENGSFQIYFPKYEYNAIIP